MELMNHSMKRHGLKLGQTCKNKCNHHRHLADEGALNAPSRGRICLSEASRPCSTIDPLNEFAGSTQGHLAHLGDSDAPKENSQGLRHCVRARERKEHLILGDGY